MIFLGMSRQQYLNSEFGKVDSDLENVFKKKKIGKK